MVAAAHDGGRVAYLSSLVLLAMGKFYSGLLARAEQGLSLAGLTAVQLAHGSTRHALAQACLPNPGTQLSRHRLWVSTSMGCPCSPPAAPKGGLQQRGSRAASKSGRFWLRSLGPAFRACSHPLFSSLAFPGLPDGPDDVRGGPLRGQRAPYLPGEHAGH